MVQDCRIDVRFFPAPADFADCFTSIYRLELTVAEGARVEDWLQPEWGNLRVFSGDMPAAQIGDQPQVAGARFTVTGPSSLSNRFSLGTTRMWGIGLLPLGWARLIRRPALAYANFMADAEAHPDFARFAPLAAVFDGEPGDEPEFARIIAALRVLDGPVRDGERIRAVHAAMVEDGLGNVADFAARAGLSTRALERVCRRHFGFTPKLLLRRQRFMRSIAAFMLAGGDGKWSEAIDDLYTDQAHFNHECHEFMGMGPREYAALPHPILASFMAERARAHGSPVQVLDRPRGLT
jgi:AraC-like DNA-binding protein